MSLDRRQFLRLFAAAAAGTTLGSCVQVSPRYRKPERLSHPEELLLLANASVIDVRRGNVLRGHGILIKRSRILDVCGPNQNEPLRPDRRIDLAGAYVLPGLINAHCHMTLPGAIGFGPGFFAVYERQLERNCEQCVIHGVTTVRDMLAVSGFLDGIRSKIAHDGLVGPRIISCCAMDIHGGYGDKMSIFHKKRFWRPANTPQEGRLAVEYAAEHGADFIKLFQQPRQLFLPGAELPVMDTRTISAIQDEAARRGMVVALHHTTLSGLFRGIEGGVRCFEHMATDGPIPEAALRALLDRHCVVVPTASVAFALAYERRGDPHWGKGFTLRIARERLTLMPELVRRYCEPELVEDTLRFFAKLSEPRSFEKRHLIPWPDPSTMNAAADTGAANTRTLYEAGVLLGIGNDGGVPLIFPGALWLELVLLEEQGMEPADLLRMATYENARLLQIDTELGRIEKGKVADLVVFEQNPLETVRHTMDPRMVFHGGELAYRS